MNSFTISRTVPSLVVLIGDINNATIIDDSKVYVKIERLSDITPLGTVNALLEAYKCKDFLELLLVNATLFKGVDKAWNINGVFDGTTRTI